MSDNNDLINPWQRFKTWLGKLAKFLTCLPLKAAVKVSLSTSVLYAAVWLLATVI